jgi:glutathione reductase (NADPH)
MQNSSAYDLLVLGTGTAASTVAHTVRSAGRRVGVIDFRPFGGTCALRGCDPKKVLVGVARAVDHARRMHDKGVAGDHRIEWPELMAFKRTFTDPVPGQREQAFAEKGIDTWRGKARFVGPTTLDVDGTRLEAGRILIATGAEPVKLGITGEEHLITSDEFLAMEKLPRRIAIVGGGYIAAEFSGIAAVAGAEVTVFQRGDRMLTPFEPELVAWLMDAFEAHGIDVRTKRNVEAIEQKGGGYVVSVSANGQSETVEADLVVHAAGRTPALESLDLDAAGVEVGNGRLRLNDYLQSTTNGAVYAAGDAAQAGPPLTPVASHDAEVVAANLLEGNHAKPDYRGVPGVAFSMPPIAAVGMSEQAAKEQGKRFRVKCKKASGWYTARQQAQPVYGFKVLVEEESERILGAHLVGPHADEVINLFALAIRHELKATDLKATFFGYPTGASDIAYMLET